MFAFLRFNIPHKNKVFGGYRLSILGFIFYLFTMYFVTNESVILSFVPHKSLMVWLLFAFLLFPYSIQEVFLVELGTEKVLFWITTTFTLDFNLPIIMVASRAIIAGLTATLMLFSQLAFKLAHEITTILFLIYLFVWYVVLFLFDEK